MPRKPPLRVLYGRILSWFVYGVGLIDYSTGEYSKAAFFLALGIFWRLDAEIVDARPSQENSPDDR